MVDEMPKIFLVLINKSVQEIWLNADNGIKKVEISPQEILTKEQSDWIVGRMIEFGLEASAYRDSPDCHDVKEVEKDIELNYQACLVFKAWLKKLEAIK
jgi:hypothetical protein